MAIVTTDLPETIADWLDRGVSLSRHQWRRRKYWRETLAQSEALQAKLEESRDQYLISCVKRLYTHPYFAFEPRPDNPANGDQQTGFLESQAFTTVALGGTGCLGGEELIYDPVHGFRRLDTIDGDFCVLARRPDTGKLVRTTARKPWIKGIAPLYRWTLSNGVSVVATEEHRVVTSSGRWITLDCAWREQAPLLCQQSERESRAVGRTCEPSRRSSLSAELITHNLPRQFQWPSGLHPRAALARQFGQQTWNALPVSTSEFFQPTHALSAMNWWKTVANYRWRYCPCVHLCDELPHPEEASCRYAAPLLGGARERSRQSWRTGASLLSKGHIHACRLSGRPSRSSCDAGMSHGSVWKTWNAWRVCLLSFETACIHDRGYVASSTGMNQRLGDLPLLAMSLSPARTSDALDSLATEGIFSSTHPAYFEHEDIETTRIIRREWVRTSEFYDFEVPGFGNYIHANLVNANSGKSYIGAQRCIKFLCEDQPPPIKDTPFFVIADNLEEASKACWAQKLYDLLPHEWIDWERITWRSQKMNFPKIVPLRPWNTESENNWAIYFCGYTQDRKAFQAIAAGGAWFTEQFPYDIYEEVVGRMRQWMYQGAIWLEFTPLDPTDSVKVQDLYEKWTRGELDDSQWSFHRLNTEEAAKSGHIKKEFVDTLKATISPEMLATRLRGDFGSYEGVIYQSFNPLVHFIPGTQFEHCPDDINLTYKRSIDWGAGPSNAFVVLWGVKDTMGRWFIFDEYYTTDQMKTWEDHVREIHKKDGWHLVCEVSRGIPRYHLEPIEGVPQRWRYDRSNFGQTYAPPEQPDLFREFAKYCLPVTPAKNSQQSGIDCVRVHLKFNDLTREQMTEPRLFIDRKRCPNLARELPALQWQVPPKHGVNPRDAKMEQKKINDHSPDALRYLIYSDWQGNTGNLSAFKVEAPVRPQIRFKR